MVKGNDLYALTGKILRVNLSNGQVSTEPSLQYAKEWLGASGIAIKMLYDELKPWVTPYEPANKLIVGAGPLIGTTAPGATKINVSTLGPMTGGWSSGCSDSHFGPQLKYAGYDSIIIEGRSHTPVYLWIHDENVELRNASHLWGKTTWETLDAIRQELGDSSLHALSIGPAGENLARGACIIQDTGRAIGRGGSGAVMGSKNLKGIVAKGTGSVRVADSKRFMDAVAKSREMIQKTKGAATYHRYGTLSCLPRKQEISGISYKNFQETRLPDDVAALIDPRRTIDRYTVGRVSFPGCAIGGCGRVMHVTDGPYAGLRTECIQWEVFGTLQCRLAILEPTFMLEANALCNQLGLDVDAAGGAIGWAMECYQRGIIDEKDTGGLKLDWGDANVALDLIRKISCRQGFGDILAEGCARASDIIGRDSGYYAVHLKGQDLYEPCRGANGWALGATTSTRGGGHTTGSVVIESSSDLDVEKARKVYGVDNPDKPRDYDGKAKMVKYYEVLTRVCTSLGICVFNTTYHDAGMMDLPDLAELYSAATGWETSVGDFERLAMRQLNLEKALNLRHTGFDRKDDMPAPRDLNEPIPTGDLAGWKIDEKSWNGMLDEYYDLHGWDRTTSFPKREILVELGLEDVADDLSRIGKLR